MPRLDQRLSLASTSDDSVWRWVYRAGLAAGIAAGIGTVYFLIACLSTGLMVTPVYSFLWPAGPAIVRWETKS
jgi:hypothetical protein